jgi:hypothetical protein
VNGPVPVVPLRAGHDGHAVLSPGGLSVSRENLHADLRIDPAVEFLAWILDQSMRRSGGDSVQVWWHRSSGIFCVGSRDKREATPVKVQKGGEQSGLQPF